MSGCVVQVAKFFKENWFVVFHLKIYAALKSFTANLVKLYLN